MRCGECSAWVTPDLEACPACGRRLSTDPRGVGQLERLRAQVVSDLERRKGDIWESSARPTAVDAVGDRLTRQLETDLGLWDGGSGARPSPAAPAGAEVQPVVFEAEPLGVLNLLLLQAGFSPFRRVRLDGVPRGREQDLKLRVEARPAAIHPLQVPLSDLAPPDFELLRISPRYEEFFGLEEAVPGQLEVAVIDGAAAVAERSYPVTVQNPNEWINRRGVEVALAGAVTPNAASVGEMYTALPDDFPGYQSGDPAVVARQVRVVYDAIAGLGLKYIGVPPSFEGTGQKVLFPDEVLASRRGCCIDIATLTAALLERAGLSPLIFLVRDRARGWGHAYCGVWTAPIQAKRPVIRDAERLAGAVEEGDLLAWNSTTYFDRKGDTGFEAAVEAGSEMLRHLEYALDIAACRRQQVKPVNRRSS